ncbi:hypothetical protein [Devosia rhizoryzae]|uniref:Uncharacterized protein n=1 Tax=Devosia rhizoryzae TaxID=2774137 RepID=A0ABX7C9S8_9HYPH|nr:hypothetical protein [Devosia rhizoryzae]QQR41025.1 hypothetical protein JI748_08650 [Devosia rhizoryzae]
MLNPSKLVVFDGHLCGSTMPKLYLQYVSYAALFAALVLGFAVTTFG